MKQTLTLFAALVLLAVGATAQKLSYSAVVRNSANELQANKTLTVGVSIANNATGNPAVYSETHSGVQTNQNGLLTLTIGEGTNVSGNLSNVTWSSAYITTTYTIDGSTVTNTVAVNAVPYALYAENSGTSTPVNDGVLTITMPDGTTKTFTANQLGNTNVNIPAAPPVNDGQLTIKQGENTLGTFSANQVGPTEVNIPAAPVVNNGTLTINMPDGTAKTFTANQSDPTEVTIPTYTLTAGDLINVINNMTAEEKAQMCAALAALGCSGTEPTPPTPTPVCPSVDLEGNTFQLNKGTENYSASFGYNPGSGNPTVTAAYSTTSGGEFQCTNCMTVNATDGVISISIPVSAVNLSAATQLNVTVTITSDVCDQVITLTGTYEEPQIPTFECPAFFETTVTPSNGDTKLTFKSLIDLNDNAFSTLQNAKFTVTDHNDATNTFTVTATLTNQDLNDNNFPAMIASIVLLPPAIGNNQGSNQTTDYSSLFGKTLDIMATCEYNGTLTACNGHVATEDKNVATYTPEVTPTCPTLGATTITPASNATFTTYLEIETVINDYDENLVNPATAKFLITYTTESMTEPITTTVDNANASGAIMVDDGLMRYYFPEQQVVISMTVTPSIALAGDCATLTMITGEPGTYPLACPSFVEQSTTVTPDPNTPTVMVIQAQIQNYAGEENVSVENSGVKIKVNNSTIATIVAGYNTLENPIPHIEISDAGLMTATIDCANYGTSFTVVPFLDSYCIDGIVDYTYTNHVDVEGTPVEVTMTAPTPTTPVDGQPCPGTPTVEDHDGNVYNTVQIGTQCWTKENMRVVPANATNGTNLTSNNYSNDEPFYYINPNVDASVYGYYYNWSAANQVCPEGWHLPSTEEWTTMEQTQTTMDVSGTAATLYGDYAGKLAADGWYTSSTAGAPGYAGDPNHNASGFSIVPAGKWDEGFYSKSYAANFWTSTGIHEDNAWSRTLNYDYVAVGRAGYNRYHGYSVRCLKDATSGGGETPTTECPTLGDAEATLTDGVLFATTPINGSYDNSVEFHYDITWTVDNNIHTATADYVETENNVLSLGPNGFALSNINEDLSGKTITIVPSCTCNVAAGETVEFGTGATVTVPAATTFECGTSTVKDHQNNVYNTVQIGDQCWTKENMRCTTSPKGNLTEGSEASYYQPYYYNNADASTNRNIPLEDRGMYYNWAGAMDTVFATTDDRNVSFEGRRGICPEGWHVPSDAEWTQMQEYVSNYKENDEYKYRCGGDATFIAKALAIDKDYWIIEPDVVHEPCEPDYAPTTNNATGFSAVPAGNWNHMNNNTGFYNAGKYACFWSSSSYDSDNVFYHYLVNYYDVMGRISFDKRRGFSVRCLRD